MTPHLHPRSRLTSSLFGATLAVSFLVVAMPHIVPCPAPRVRFADSEIEVLKDGRRRRISQREPGNPGADANNTLSVHQAASTVVGESGTVMRKAAHECPVPKPRGVLGKLLGFKTSEAMQSDTKTNNQNVELKREFEKPRR